MINGASVPMWGIVRQSAGPAKWPRKKYYCDKSIVIDPAARIRFYLHKDFRAAEIQLYLHKDVRVAGIEFSLHKDFHEETNGIFKTFPRCARQFVKNFLRICFENHENSKISFQIENE